MRKVVYTCIKGNYDTLKEPVYTAGWDYICYTDQPFKSDIWQIKPMPESMMSDVRQQRRIKIFHPEILNEYDFSIWIDGSMKINIDLDKFVKMHLFSDLCIMKHPSRNCTYEEAQACINLQKDHEDVIKRQMRMYRDDFFPENEGMVASGIIMRNHTKEVKDFCIKWWNEVSEHSHRDQLSFNYAAWNDGFNYATFSYQVLADQIQLCRHLR
jgi:O-antigen biosynthesis protein